MKNYIEFLNEEANFPAGHGIDDNVQFITGEGEEPRYGRIARVTFTKAKVWYDILDDVTGDVITQVDSAFVSKIKQIPLPEAPES